MDTSNETSIQEDQHRHLPSCDLTKDEFQWKIRCELEAQHRTTIFTYYDNYLYAPSIQDITHLPEITVDQLHDICNKSVPIYIPWRPSWWLLRTVLHNYIYMRWFLPYQSEIEHQRFICKFIIPKGLPDDDDDDDDESLSHSDIIQKFISLNGAICTKVEARRQFYTEQHALGHEFKAQATLEPAEPELHILQPLFRSLLIIVLSEHYSMEDSNTVGRLPVIVALTGVHDDLSAPITFEPISEKIDSYLREDKSIVRTTLEAAIDFVMSLEAREAAAFGLRPDAWAPHAWTMHKLPTPEGVPRLIGPSSSFVNTDKYPEWSGDGWRTDSFIMAGHEAIRFRWPGLTSRRAD